MTVHAAAPPAPTPPPHDKGERRDPLRWLGLEPYGEEHQALYHGRGEEVGDLQRLVRGNRLTLLIGKMGSGKTSLLRAGFLPRERKAGCLGVYVRPDLSAGAPKLGVQVMRAIDAEAREAGLQGPRPADAESLWEYLHLNGGEFWTEDYRIALPIIVLDQFEELLTPDQSHRRADSEAFLSELSDLIEGRVPKELRLQVLDDPPGDPRYAPKSHHYKIVVGLREESLAELDRHRRVLPTALFHSRCRLTPMTGEQAMEVVTKAGADIVDAAVAERIVRKVAGDDVVGLQDLEVEPAILSVFCRWLDDERAKKGMGRITQALLDRFGDRILLDFYEDSLKGLPGRPRSRRWPTWFVHRFIENELLTDQDTRTQADPPDALPSRWLRMDREAVRSLEDRHVLRVEKGDEKDQVKLSHDVLIEPVRQSGRRRRRRLLWGLGMALLLLGFIGLPAAGISGYAIGSGGRNDEADEADEALVRVLQAQVSMTSELNRVTELIRLAVSSMRESEDTASARAMLQQADDILSGGAFEACDGPFRGSPAEVRLLELTCRNRSPLRAQVGLASTMIVTGELEVDDFDAAADDFDAASTTINRLFNEVFGAPR